MAFTSPAARPSRGFLRRFWSRLWSASWRDRGPVAFVWSVWVWCGATMLRWIAANGSAVPYFDEWEVVPVLVGAQPITLKWLWSQHNEHRMWLPRLIYIAVERAARVDFRAGMFFDAALLIAAAAAMLVFLRRLRGYQSYFDAFLSLLILSPGQAENLMWSFQVQFVLATIMALAVLMLSMGSRRATPRTALALAVCALCCPLLGGNGLAFAPAFAACAMVTAFMARGSGARRPWMCGLAYATCLAAAVLTCFYFVDYTRPAKHPTSPSPYTTMRATAEFLLVGFGSGSFAYRDELFWAAAPLLTGAMWLLGRALFDPRERGRAIRMLLFLAAIGTLAAGVAWARIALGPTAMSASRYATLAMPFWCAVYCAYELAPRSRRQFAQGALLLLPVAFLLKNRDAASADALYFNGVRGPVAAQIAAGATITEIVAQNPALYYGGPELLAQRFRMLRDHKVRLFRNLKD